MRLAAIVLVVLSGCALKLDPAPLQVQGEVVHKVEIDPVQLSAFFTDYCKQTLTDQAAIDQCVADELARFWNAVNASSTSGG